MIENYFVQTYLPIVADLINFLVWFSMPHRILIFRKDKRWLFITSVGINMVIAIICRSIPVLLTSPLKTIVISVVFLSYIFFSYEESNKKKSVVSVLWFVTMCVADMLAVIVLSVLNISLTEPVGGLPVHLISGLLTAVFSYILMFITSMIYDKIRHKKVTNKIWQFQLVVISQFLFILIVGYSSQKNDNTIENMVLRDPGYTILLIATIIISIFADVFLYRILLTNSQNYELKKEIEIINYKENLEFEYYEKLKKDINETRKLNHDFSNVVAVIEGIIKSTDIQDNRKLAEGLLEEVKETLKKTKIRYYCENEIVNLIVIRKSENIVSKGIDFSANLDIPKNLCVKSFDLCRIFTNIMDNAFDACLSAEDIKKCFIVLSSQISENYINIKCENYYDAKIENKGDTLISTKVNHKGLGIEVLKEIAKVYSGDVNIMYGNNIFTINISLKVR